MEQFLITSRIVKKEAKRLSSKNAYSVVKQRLEKSMENVG